MITEDYVSFDTAKLLKEKGFDARCPMIYTVDGEMLYTDVKHHNMYAVTNKQLEYYTDIIAPTQAMAMKWLREVHCIHIVTAFLGPSLKWTPTIWKIDMVIPESKHVKSTINTWETYEESCEVAIKYCLKNLI